ncbi:hypothetical protein HID58_052166 [Brassica napus]|uniref:BnaC03g21790D protein n=2 Tax=Brassica napus TaxID=3708 RepID=A0A078FMW2_BRANA|nr:hypothetical protein HID58_052166 [Brassica napus]CAF1700660.1 unnamed protein product [Brassica napus]CDY14416.1 BnaC03g21790D [Brassica napus]
MQNTPLGNGGDGAIPISFDHAKPSWLLLLFGNLSLSSVSLLSPTVSVSQTPSSKSNTVADLPSKEMTSPTEKKTYLSFVSGRGLLTFQAQGNSYETDLESRCVSQELGMSSYREAT